MLELLSSYFGQFKLESCCFLSRPSVLTTVIFYSCMFMMIICRVFQTLIQVLCLNFDIPECPPWFSVRKISNLVNGVRSLLLCAENHALHFSLHFFIFFDLPRFLDSLNITHTHTHLLSFWQSEAGSRS